MSRTFDEIFQEILRRSEERQAFEPPPEPEDVGLPSSPLGALEPPPVEQVDYEGMLMREELEPPDYSGLLPRSEYGVQGYPLPKGDITPSSAPWIDRGKIFGAAEEPSYDDLVAAGEIPRLPPGMEPTDVPPPPWASVSEKAAYRLQKAVRGQLAAELDDPGVGGRAAQALRSVARGVPETLSLAGLGQARAGIAASPEEDPGIPAAGLPVHMDPWDPALMPMTPEDKTAALAALDEQAGLTSEFYEEMAPTDPRTEGEFWAQGLPHAMASTVALGAGGMMVGPAGVMTMGSALGFESGWQRAKEGGASDEDALKAALMEGGLGTTEVIPISKWVSKINKLVPKGGMTLTQKILEGGAETVEEAIQEFGQTVGGNYAYRKFVDENQELMEGALEAGSTGGASGLFFSLIANALAPGRQAGVAGAAPAAAEQGWAEEEAPPAVPPPHPDLAPPTIRPPEPLPADEHQRAQNEAIARWSDEALQGEIDRLKEAEARHEPGGLLRNVLINRFEDEQRIRRGEPPLFEWPGLPPPEGPGGPVAPPPPEVAPPPEVVVPPPAPVEPTEGPPPAPIGPRVPPEPAEGVAPVGPTEGPEEGPPPEIGPPPEPVGPPEPELSPSQREALGFFSRLYNREGKSYDEAEILGMRRALENQLQVAGQIQPGDLLHGSSGAMLPEILSSGELRPSAPDAGARTPDGGLWIAPYHEGRPYAVGYAGRDGTLPIVFKIRPERRADYEAMATEGNAQSFEMRLDTPVPVTDLLVAWPTSGGLRPATDLYDIAQTARSLDFDDGQTYFGSDDDAPNIFRRGQELARRSLGEGPGALPGPGESVPPGGRGVAPPGGPGPGGPGGGTAGPTTTVGPPEEGRVPTPGPSVDERLESFRAALESVASPTLQSAFRRLSRKSRLGFLGGKGRVKFREFLQDEYFPKAFRQAMLSGAPEVVYHYDRLSPTGKARLWNEDEFLRTWLEAAYRRVEGQRTAPPKGETLTAQYWDALEEWERRITDADPALRATVVDTLVEGQQIYAALPPDPQGEHGDVMPDTYTVQDKDGQRVVFKDGGTRSLEPWQTVLVNPAGPPEAKGGLGAVRRRRKTAPPPDHPPSPPPKPTEEFTKEKMREAIERLRQRKAEPPETKPPPPPKPARGPRKLARHRDLTAPLTETDWKALREKWGIEIPEIARDMVAEEFASKAERHEIARRPIELIHERGGIKQTGISTSYKDQLAKLHGPQILGRRGGGTNPDDLITVLEREGVWPDDLGHAEEDLVEFLKRVPQVKDRYDILRDAAQGLRQRGDLDAAERWQESEEHFERVRKGEVPDQRIVTGSELAADYEEGDQIRAIALGDTDVDVYTITEMKHEGDRFMGVDIVLQDGHSVRLDENSEIVMLDPAVPDIPEEGEGAVAEPAAPKYRMRPNRDGEWEVEEQAPDGTWTRFSGPFASKKEAQARLDDARAQKELPGVTRQGEERTGGLERDRRREQEKEADRYRLKPTEEAKPPRSLFGPQDFESAKERLKKKMGPKGGGGGIVGSPEQPGFDPQLMTDLLTVGGHLVQEGARTRKAFEEQFVEELGDWAAEHVDYVWQSLQAHPALKPLIEAGEEVTRGPEEKPPTPAPTEEAPPKETRPAEREGPESRPTQPPAPVERGPVPPGEGRSTATGPTRTEGVERPEAGVRLVSEGYVPEPNSYWTEEDEAELNERDIYLAAHQAENVDRAFTAWETGGGFIIADDTGTGKTWSGGAIMWKLRQQYPDARILLVVPNPDIANQWRNDVLDAMGFTMKKLSGNAGNGQIETQENAPIHFVSYHQMRELHQAYMNDKNSPRIAREGSMPVELPSDWRGATFSEWLTGKRGEEGAIDLVIFDESQKIKNVAGGKPTALAGADLAHESAMTLFVSATPVASITEMDYLSPLGLWKSATDLLQRYGITYDDKKKVWRGLTPGKLKQINEELVRKGRMIKHELRFDGMKNSEGEEISLTAEMRFVKPTKGDYAQYKLIHKRIDEYKKLLKIPPRRRTAEVDASRGFFNVPPGKPPSWVPRNLESIRTGLGRWMLEISKVQEAARLAERELKAGKQVAIFTLWLEGSKMRTDQPWLQPLYDSLKEYGIDTRSPVDLVGDILQEKGYKVAQITGRQAAGSAMRKGAIQTFQEGDADVAIATIAAGGTGLSLHHKKIDGKLPKNSRPRVQINMSTPYVADTMKQVAGRTFRMGSETSAEQYWLFLDSQFEKKYARRLATKMKEMGGILRGETKDATAEEMEDYDFPELEQEKEKEQNPLDDFKEEELEEEEAPEKEDVPQDRASFMDKYLAQAQRGEPEQAMLAIQHSQLSGEWGSVAEHLGDLTHRMSESVTSRGGGYEFVEPKVRKLLLWAGERYGKEVEEQIGRNLQYTKEEAAKGEGWAKKRLAELGSADLEGAMAKYEELGDAYAKAHDQLPVFNEVQKLARDAAVSFGLREYGEMLRRLKKLESYLNDERGWEDLARPTDEVISREDREYLESEDATEFDRSEIELEARKKEDERAKAKAKHQAWERKAHEVDANLVREWAQEKGVDVPEFASASGGVDRDIRESDFPQGRDSGSPGYLPDRMSANNSLPGPTVAAAADELNTPARRRAGPKRHDMSVNSRHKISNAIEALGRMAGVTVVRAGRIRQRWAAGIYKVKGQVIRLKKPHDKNFETLAHEVGHHFDKVLFGGYAGRNQSQHFKEYQEELIQLGRNLYGPRKPYGGYRAEGVAEFVRLYMTRPGVAKSAAPAFFEFFETWMGQHEPKILEGLQDVRREIELWAEGGPLARQRARIRSTTWFSRMRDRLSRMTDLYRMWIDTAVPFRRARDAMEKQRGVRFFGENDFYELRRTQSAIAFARGEAFIHQGVVDYRTGEIVGESLEEILKQADADKALDDFGVYMVSLRDKSKMRQGKETGAELGDAAEAIRILEEKYPYFKETARRLRAWNKGVLNYLVHSGRLSEKQRDLMIKRNLDYVPFARIFEAAERALYGDRSSKARTPNSLMRFKGSQRDIQSPLEALVNDLYAKMRVAHENETRLAFVRASMRTEGGMAIGAEEIPPDMKPTKITPQEAARIARSVAEELGLGLDAEDFKLDEHTMGLLADLGLKVWRPNWGKMQGDKELFEVYINGKKKFYQTHRDIVEVMDNIDEATFQTIMRFLKWVPPFLPARAKLVRYGAIRNLRFIARNLIRDAVHRSVFGVSTKPPGWDMISGLIAVIRGGERRLEWEHFGGSMVTMTSMDMRRAEKRLKDIWRNKHPVNVTLNLMNPFRTLGLLAQISEEAGRVAEMKAALKQVERGGKDKRGRVKVERRPETGPSAMRRAAFMSREYIDFNRSGVYARVLNQIIPFFNPAVQDMDVIARAFKERPVRTTMRVLAHITVPSLLLHAWNMAADDDRPEGKKYADLPQWRRDIGWNFYIGEHWWTVPKPFGAGIMFGTMPERVLEWVKGDDPDIYKTVINTLTRGMHVPWYPPAPELENYANWDFYFDRPIVPRGREKWVARYQHGPYASDFSVWLGRKLNISPAKIDNQLDLVGGLGRDIVTLAGMTLRAFGADVGPEKPARGFAAYPVTDAFYTPMPTGQNKETERFYRHMKQAEKAYETAMGLANQKGLELEQVSNLLTEEENLWAQAFPPMSRVAEQIGRFRKLRAFVVDDVPLVDAPRAFLVQIVETSPLLDYKEKQELVHTINSGRKLSRQEKKQAVDCMTLLIVATIKHSNKVVDATLPKYPKKLSDRGKANAKK